MLDILMVVFYIIMYLFIYVPLYGFADNVIHVLQIIDLAILIYNQFTGRHAI